MDWCEILEMRGWSRCIRARITSSARVSIGGTTSPSALAVLRLTTKPNLIRRCTGRSAGFGR